MSNRARAWVCAPFVVCAILYAPVMGGYFLSDDMAVIYVLSGWNDHGELWGRLFSKFGSGLDAPSHYFRPLAFLSFGVNLAWQGLNPVPWHLVNLAGHLAAGVAVYRISSALQPETPSRLGPCLAAALFLLCGTSAEAVAWISGRYDIFATAFSLWAAALYLRSRSGFDSYELGALACGMLALASKESGAILPGLIGCLAWVKHGQQPWTARWKAIARDLAPWLLLIAGYFALRLAIFGSMLQVYPGVHPFARITAGSWRSTIGAALPWLSVAFPDKAFLAIAGILSLLWAAAGLTAVIRDRSLWRQSIGLLAATLWSLALLLPHLSGLPANGEGGRLLYTTSALLALCLAIPFSPRRSTGAPAVWFVSLAAVALASLLTQAVLLNAALRGWRIAGTQMAQLVSALPAITRSLGPDGYAFVIAPDAIGPVPFARNANGAMVLRPIQQQPLLSSMIVFLPGNMPNVPSMLRRQLIPTLKRYTLDQALETMQGSATEVAATDIVWPTDVFCWRLDTAALSKVELLPAWRDATRWEAGIAEGLRRAGCNEPPLL